MEFTLNKEYLAPPSIKDDFYQGINYQWLKSNPVPKEHSSWSNFHQLIKSSNDQVKLLLDTDPTTDEEFKLYIMWTQGLDQAQLDKRGHSQLSKLFDRFNLPSNPTNQTNFTPRDLNVLLGQLIANGNGSLIDFGVYPDKKDSTQNVLYLDVGSLGLPDRDYYLNPSMEQTQKDYIQWLDEFAQH